MRNTENFVCGDLGRKLKKVPKFGEKVSENFKFVFGDPKNTKDEKIKTVAKLSSENPNIPSLTNGGRLS